MTRDLPLDVLKRPVALIGAAVALVIVVVWLLVFFLPQGNKLSSLQAQKTSLQAAVAQDEAKVALLRRESHHVGQIQAMYTSLQGYVPATADLYTYIQTFSGAARASGVAVTSLAPGTLSPVAGTSYSAVPITAQVKGTYDQTLALIHAIYALPRLTDINSISISGGGPGTTRGVVLSVTMQLAIFTSQKAATAGAGAG